MHYDNARIVIKEDREILKHVLYRGKVIFQEAEEIVQLIVFRMLTSYIISYTIILLW
jgi:hypothetical protein